VSNLLKADALALCALWGFFLSPTVFAVDELDEEAPNVVLILVDDLGWMDLSCQGSEIYRTPNIDRIATEGARFTEFYAAAAICSPTRAAVQTGRYPARVGVTDWIRARFQGGAMPADGVNPSGHYHPSEKPLEVAKNALWMNLKETTIAEALKPAGYSTGYIGKWHLGMDAHYPTAQGYEVNLGGCDYGQPPSYFDPFSNKTLEGIPHLEPREEGQYLTDREADEAVAFIRERAAERFFLQLANYAVHTPIQAKPELVEAWRAEKGEREYNAVYAAMVQSVDECVGRVLDELDALGLTDETLILFTSDNGGLKGPTDNTPLRSGKGYPYEGGIRVPLLARWPGVIPAGSMVESATNSIDLLPTIVDACGGALPRAPIDGVSLMGVLTGKVELPERDLFWHFPHYRGGVKAPYSIVRSGDWKLIRYWGLGNELYHLGEDLGERDDRSGAEPEVVSELSRKLEDHLRELRAIRPRTPIPPSADTYMGREIAQTMHWLGANWLIRATREDDEHTKLFLDALSVQEGQTVCDLGCGNGYHSLELAKRVGEEGRVIAVDIQPEMLDLLEERALELGVANVDLVIGEFHDPRLERASCDLILMADVYHELSHPAEVLKLLKEALKPGGRVAALEFRAEDPDVPIKPVHKMTKAQVIAEFTANGFELVEEFDELPWQHLLFFGVR
jgi:arylsulfatase A-like enzyme/ubiquinone/menaquinone biosynthesis C-methylase UbiE